MVVIFFVIRCHSAPQVRMPFVVIECHGLIKNQPSSFYARLIVIDSL